MFSLSSAHNGRDRLHHRQLPGRMSHLTDCNFIVWMLFCDSYWLYCFILSCTVQLPFVVLKEHLIDLMSTAWQSADWPGLRRSSMCCCQLMQQIGWLLKQLRCWTLHYVLQHLRLRPQNTIPCLRFSPTTAKVKVGYLLQRLLHESDLWQEALYNLASGNWLTWTNDTAAHYAAIHCPRQRTIGPAVCS